MTRIATAGMYSCATIAISGFKDVDRDLNDDYEKDAKSFKGLKDGLTARKFYNDVLYPTSQPLGKTGEYPFTRMMEEIDDCNLSTKLIVAALPEFQLADGYWRQRLEKWGFKEITKTQNTIGSVNTLFIRNPNEVK